MRTSIQTFVRLLCVSICYGHFVFNAACFAAEPSVDSKVDYTKQVAPVLRKYCAGCHNDGDKEGDFSLESFASLQQGIDDQPAVLAGDSAGSKLWRAVSGEEPQMPPEGEPAPSAAELALLKLWIDQGAKGPKGKEPDRLMLRVPKIESQTSLDPITSIACSPEGKTIAVARYGRVELQELSEKTSKWETIRSLEEIPGKVEAVHFCFDGQRLITASGVSGSGGIATLWDRKSGQRIRDFRGHRDIIFDAEVSPDQTLLATCSYDRKIILWDLTTGEQIRTLSGHNGAIFDIAFHPAGTVLASASADDTCKLWRVSDGTRLDTLGQPLKEQYAIDFTRDGRFVVAAGADNQIRVWKIQSTEKPTISPLIMARFAHEAPIVAMCFTTDGSRLISAAEDRTIKVWDARKFVELELLENLPAVVDTISPMPDGQKFAAGRLDGVWELLPLPPLKTDLEKQTDPAIQEIIPTAKPIVELNEAEPNNTPQQAQRISLPATVKGVIHNPKSTTDFDQFRFAAKAGEEWVIEVKAARNKSKLDSFIDVSDSDGKPIERVILQAVRDSYFTFRGKNGNQVNDFRLFQWEEMEPNELLYCNGEVVKLWKAPIGADAGFLVYPGSGKRWGYFDTSGLTHALNEPCYIVEAHTPGTKLVPNGLPVIPIYYENDDAARRECGKDSKLFFTAPVDGEYILRLRDVRGDQGPDFTYAVAIRPAAPDFAVTLKKRKLTIHPGNGEELEFSVDRQDQFDGPITIHASGIPAGFTCNETLVIEPEQITASGVLAASKDASSLTSKQLKKFQFTATAMINGRKVSHPVPGVTELKIAPRIITEVAIEPVEGERAPLNPGQSGPLEFEIEPGETIQLKVVAHRHDDNSIIKFGRGDSGRNLPFGLFIDNIGLNGLMIPADKSEQTFFITAYDWVPEQTRTFHLQATSKGRPTTPLVILHVVKERQKTVAKP